MRGETRVVQIFGVIGLVGIIVCFVRVPAFDLITFISAAVGGIGLLLATIIMLVNGMKERDPKDAKDPWFFAHASYLIGKYRYSLLVVCLAAAVAALLICGGDLIAALPGLIALPILFGMMHLVFCYCVESIVAVPRRLRVYLLLSYSLPIVAIVFAPKYGWFAMMTAIFIVGSIMESHSRAEQKQGENGSQR